MRVIAGVILAAAVLTASVPVSAQSSMSTSLFSEEGAFAPVLKRGDLDVFARVLSLKPEEVKGMEELYSSYCTVLKNEGSAVRAFVTDAQEESETMADYKLLNAAKERLKAWEKRSDEIKRVFMEDLRALLTKDQESRWPIVERELRRLKSLDSGRIPGEDVDLVKLVEALPAGARASASLNDALERYSQELDRAIVSRGAYLDKHREEFEELIKTDPERARRVFLGATKERVALADLNGRYARTLAAELPAPAAAALESAFFAQANSHMMEATKGQKYLDAAAKLGTLSAEQRSQFKRLVEEYDAAKMVLLRKMAEQDRAWAETVIPHRLAEALDPSVIDARDRGWNQKVFPVDHPMTKLRRSRYELDRSTRRKVEALLTLEQRSTLPDQGLEAVTYRDFTPWGL